MRQRNRREFLADVGRGMIVASIGAGMAGDLQLAPVFAGEGSDALVFGKLEPLLGTAGGARRISGRAISPLG